MKKTIILGASPKPSRYSHLAVLQLLDKGYEVIPIGNRKKASIKDLDILNGQPPVEDVHTITLYINPSIQKDYYDYILSLHPQRIIFNPGTVNPELIQLAKEKGIHVEIACTLVMLSTGQY